MKAHDTEHVFIGDIHGHASTLVALLGQLGWKERNGRLEDPGGQQLVFVGDLIDRGQENMRTVELVHDLVERDLARCVMGNHEFNAVQFHTEHPDQPGRHLREQNTKNTKQHKEVLAEVQHRPGDWQEMLAWFKTLPLALEGETWRCVHACWHPDHLDALQKIGDGWYLPEQAWVAAARAGTPEYEAVETLLKGPEFELPDGASFFDKDKHERRHARIKWWEPAPRTLGESLLIHPRTQGLDEAASYQNPEHPGYPEDATPVFFGHYWRSSDEIEPERPNAVCLDYSIGKGDRLVAYRHDGSPRIQNDRFHWQRAQKS